MTLLSLFLEFCLIGALSFGGGYGALALIRDIAVDKHGWLDPAALSDLVLFSEITPGPVTLNAASFTGYLTAGIPGAILPTVGCLLPSCVILSLLCRAYRKYRRNPLLDAGMTAVRPVVCALIFSAFLNLFLLAVSGVSSFADLSAGSLNAVALLLFLGCYLLYRTGSIPPFAVILFGGIAGLLML